MSPASPPVPEPLPLLQTTLAFTVQVLIARHPELLAPPEEALPRPTRVLAAARQVVAILEGLHYALEEYRASLPIPPPPMRDVDPHLNDDIPF